MKWKENLNWKDISVFKVSIDLVPFTGIEKFLVRRKLFCALGWYWVFWYQIWKWQLKSDRKEIECQNIPTLKSKSKVARAIIEYGKEKLDYKKYKIGIGCILQNQIICGT